MSLTDPRNTSDLFSAPGDFTTVDRSGDVQPLKTYGIVRIKVQGEDNEQLDLAGNMKIYLDADKVITWNFLEQKKKQLRRSGRETLLRPAQNHIGITIVKKRLTLSQGI